MNDKWEYSIAQIAIGASPDVLIQILTIKIKEGWEFQHASWSPVDGHQVFFRREKKVDIPEKTE